MTRVVTVECRNEACPTFVKSGGVDRERWPARARYELGILILLHPRDVCPVCKSEDLEVL